MTGILKPAFELLLVNYRDQFAAPILRTASFHATRQTEHARLEQPAVGTCFAKKGSP